MSYLGEWQIDDLLTFTVTTHTFSTGALTDATAPPDYRVYEDETGTALLTGSMAKLDDANTTGHYSEQITLSAANGFEEGKSYSIYITAAVAGVTGATVRNFQVEAAKATAAALATVDGIVDDILTDTGTTLDALIKDVPTVSEFNARTLAAADYFDPAADAVTLAAATHTGAVIPTVTTVSNGMTLATGAVTADAIATNAIDADALAADAVTEIQNGLATAAAVTTLAGYVDTEVAAILAAVDTEVAAIKAKTDNLPTDPADQSAVEAAITSATSGLATSASIAALNNLSAAQVNAEVDTALADYDPPTKAELDSAVAPLALEATVGALNDITAADVVTAIEAATVDGTITRLQMERIMLAFIGGLTTGGGTQNLAFLAQDDSTPRITATMDEDGNRDAVTLDGA